MAFAGLVIILGVVDVCDGVFAAGCADFGRFWGVRLSRAFRPQLDQPVDGQNDRGPSSPDLLPRPHPSWAVCSTLADELFTAVIEAVRHRDGRPTNSTAVRPHRTADRRLLRAVRLTSRLPVRQEIR